MRSRSRILFFSLALTLLSGGVGRVLACSRVGESSVCEAFGRADAVFVGKVATFARQETYFQVSEAFYGVANNSQVTLFDGYTNSTNIQTLSSEFVLKENMPQFSLILKKVSQ